MALEKNCGCLEVDPRGREMCSHGSAWLPCAGYHTRYAGDESGFVPWHWHEEIELVYIASGNMDFKIPRESFDMQKGDFLAINANVVHYAKAVGVGELKTLVFDPGLIGGAAGSVFTQKYMVPLIRSGAFIRFFVKSGGNDLLTAEFLDAFQALKYEPVGFEFTVREKLSKICLHIYQTLNISQISANTVRNSERIRDMLEYIHKNYAQDITLSDVAAAAHISGRECLRCFKKNIQLSPMQYLLKYRIMQGARLLAEKPDASVSEIALDCGFDSPSNFTKTFKRFYSKTPKEYRNN